MVVDEEDGAAGRLAGTGQHRAFGDGAVAELCGKGCQREPAGRNRSAAADGGFRRGRSDGGTVEGEGFVPPSRMITRRGAKA